MTNVFKETLENTYERTAGGELIYRDPVTNDTYYEESFGELREYQKRKAVSSTSRNGGLGLIVLALIAVSAGGGIWLADNMNHVLYRLISIALPVLFLILPFISGKIRRNPKITNILLAVSVYIFIMPVVDSFTNASNAGFAYLGLLIDACIAAAIAWGVYLIVKNIQKSIKV